MFRIRLMFVFMVAVMAGGSWVEATPRGTHGTIRRQSRAQKRFKRRMYNLRRDYRGHVHVAELGGRPAIFINTDFGQGPTANWSPAEWARFKRFKVDLQKALGTNTLQLWNPADENYLHTGTGTGGNPRLDGQFKDRQITLYNHFHPDAFQLPTPDTQRSTVLIKLKNSQLSAFNDYLGAIQNDFRGTLGRTDYNGGTPPYVSGSESGSHNCTSWVSTWARANVSNAIPYGAYPPGWVERMARTRSNASAYRGLVVFNHPDAPHTGQRVARNFELEFGYGND